jgi:hypothetical protein
VTLGWDLEVSSRRRTSLDVIFFYGDSVVVYHYLPWDVWLVKGIYL